MDDLKEFSKLFFTLFIFWMFLTLDFTFINILIGCFLSVAIYLVSYRIFFAKTRYKIVTPNAFQLARYLLFLIVEIHTSSFIHIKRILKNNSSPIILELNLDTENPFIITLIANSITMTPGTITLEVKKNRLIVLSLIDDHQSAEKIIGDMEEKFQRHFR